MRHTANSFLQCVTVADVDRLKQTRGLVPRHYTLAVPTGGVINTKERFWAAVIASLPLDPPIGLKYTRYGWDALDDSLFGGLPGLGVPAVDILWPFANDVAKVFLMRAVEFFQVVAERVRQDADAPDDPSLDVRLFLICSNETSRQRLADEFWFVKD